MNKNLNSVGRYSGLAFEMIIIIAAGTFGGIQIDKKLKLETPYFTIFLSLFAVFVALYRVIKDALSKKE